MTALMTPLRTGAPVDLAAWTIGAPRLLAGLEGAPSLDHAAHQHVHGPLPGTDLERILAFLDHAAVAGRGGAGFSLAAKLRALTGRRRRVIVNATESEPASLKDRVLLHRAPHLVLDGALAVASSVHARSATVTVHDARSAHAVSTALAQRADGRDVRVQVVRGGFVSGESRAVVRAVDGGPALPPADRTPPTSAGTLVGNAETFAQLAVLLRMGPHRFAGTGTSDEPGTTLITVGGAVGRPGVVEIPLGTPLGIVLAAARAVERPQAIVLGGYHGSWVQPIGQLRLSRAGVAAAGAHFGAGVVQVVGPDTCALGELARVAGWLAAQSATQCGPCRFGLPALAADVGELAGGPRPAGAGDLPVVGGPGHTPRPAVAAAFGHARAVTGRGACAHPDGAARFVTSGLHLLLDETDAHARGGCGRPVLGHLPIDPDQPKENGR